MTHTDVSGRGAKRREPRARMDEDTVERGGATG